MAAPTPIYPHLTEKQKDVLRAIHRFQSENGYPPTVRDLCGMLGNPSTSTVHGHLQGLREEGMVTWVEKADRTLVITPAGRLQAL